MGRESCDEFGEDIAPKESDARTMGMSCLIQVRETAQPTAYIPPAWAYHFEKKDFENKINFSTPQKWNNCNFWWMELGGLVDSIADTPIQHRIWRKSIKKLNKLTQFDRPCLNVFILISLCETVLKIEIQEEL